MLVGRPVGVGEGGVFQWGPTIVGAEDDEPWVQAAISRTAAAMALEPRANARSSHNIRRYLPNQAPRQRYIGGKRGKCKT